MRRWHSINCPHVGIFNQSSKGRDVTCPGCLEMLADGVQPLDRRPPEIVGYGRLHRFTKSNTLEDAVVGKIDGERRRARRTDVETEYEQLLLARDRMGGRD